MSVRLLLIWLFGAILLSGCTAEPGYYPNYSYPYYPDYPYYDSGSVLWFGGNWGGGHDWHPGGRDHGRGDRWDRSHGDHGGRDHGRGDHGGPQHHGGRK